MEVPAVQMSFPTLDTVIHIPVLSILVAALSGVYRGEGVTDVWFIHSPEQGCELCGLA